LTRIVRWVIASGQMTGELRGGDAAVLARCVLVAVDGCSKLSTLLDRAAGGPTREQMMDFCLSAMRAPDATAEQVAIHGMHARLH